LVALDGLPVAAALVIFVAIPITSGVITYAVRAIDPDSIASLRRTFGLTLASNLLWAILIAMGSAISLVTHAPQPLTNEFVLGAFFACSFELLVINGAFVSSTPRSLGIASVQPATTLLLASIFIVKINLALAFTTLSGLVVLAITFGFLLKFKTFKTEGAGINSLQTFQSFLKSWVSQKPAELENYFTVYSHGEPVTTRIVLTDKVALVLPGVHPGPFFPVGSYNLSELIYHELRKNDVTPMVLHGVGGHERNLPTNALTRQYAEAIADAVAHPDNGQRVQNMRGPNKSVLGSTLLTTLGFGNQLVTFLTNAPFNTDDLDPSAVDKAVSAAKESGVDLMLVDAHNSIGGENLQQPELDWSKILADVRAAPEEEFEVGAAHSSELQFEHGSDISDGGITALVFRKHTSTYALITSDSNNAVIGLRQMVIDELKKDNVELIELCTSDTHNSAARHLTSRGYRALGEDTDRAKLLATIKKLEKLAESRLERGTATCVTTLLTLPLIGDKSLNDFAVLTKQTLNFTKPYATGALASALAISLLALFF